MTAYSSGFANRPRRFGRVLKISAIAIAAAVGLGLVLFRWFGLAGAPEWRGSVPARASISVGRDANVSDEDLGVGIYPDAVREPGSAIRVRRQGEIVVSAAYTTSQDASEVVAYYSKELPGATKETEESGRIRLSKQMQGDGVADEISISITPKAPVNNGLTRIFVVHTMRSRIRR